MDDNGQLQALMEMAEGLTPLIEFAEGQKAKMIARGWGSEPAEAYASALLVGFITTIFRHAA